MLLMVLHNLLITEIQAKNVFFPTVVSKTNKSHTQRPKKKKKENKKGKTKNQAKHNLADELHSDYVNHIIKQYAEQPIR